MSAARVLIVGGGIAGVATAWWLARRGLRRVVLLERDEVLGAESTGRNAGILRTWTGVPALDELARRGARFLAAPPAGFCEHALLDPCGLVLLLGPEPPAGLAAWRARKPAVRPLDAAALRALAPHWAGGTEGALHVPDEGRIDTAALVDALAAGARAGGAELRTEATVAALLRAGGAVEGVRLASGEELRAETTVLAAGGWAGRLGAAAGSRVELTPLRRHLLVTAARADVDPRWPVVWSDPEKFYARPESGGLLVSACDQSAVEPDACSADPAVRELVAQKVARLLPRFADAGAAHFWAGMRTFGEDERFLVGPDPDLEGLFWVAGLGGHGMTTGAAVGELAAELLQGDVRDRALAAALAPARFAAARE